MTKGITLDEMRVLSTKSQPTKEEIDLIEKLAQAQKEHWISDAGPTMQHGVWDHFKGGVYLSSQVVVNVDNLEPSVVYLSMIYGTWFVRRCSEWNELVEWPDGKWRSRFVLRADSTAAPPFKVQRQL